METLKKIKDFCQDQENEFSVLGYDASKYELGYISAIREIQEICEEIEPIKSDQTQIEKLEAEKKELPTEEEIERNATIYAEEQNSCYSNDYYGFISGAKYILSLIQKMK